MFTHTYTLARAWLKTPPCWHREAVHDARLQTEGKQHPGGGDCVPKRGGGCSLPWDGLGQRGEGTLRAVFNVMFSFLFHGRAIIGAAGGSKRRGLGMEYEHDHASAVCVICMMCTVTVIYINIYINQPWECYSHEAMEGAPFRQGEVWQFKHTGFQQAIKPEDPN